MKNIPLLTYNENRNSTHDRPVLQIKNIIIHRELNIFSESDMKSIY